MSGEKLFQWIILSNLSRFFSSFHFVFSFLCLFLVEIKISQINFNCLFVQGNQLIPGNQTPKKKEKKMTKMMIDVRHSVPTWLICWIDDSLLTIGYWLFGIKIICHFGNVVIIVVCSTLNPFEFIII